MQKTILNPKYMLQSISFTKGLWLILLVIALSGKCFAQGAVGIGTGSNPPDASAVLDIVSNAKGMLVPRLTIAQRNGISNPANGLLIYNSNDAKFNYWNGAKWQEVGGGITWFTGMGAPPGQGNVVVGKAGDLYLDELTGTIYQLEIDSLNPLNLTWQRFEFNKINKKAFLISTPNNLSANSSHVEVIPFMGATINNMVLCTPNFNLNPGIVISHAWVSNVGEVTVKFYNVTGGALPLAGSFQVAIF